MDQTELVVGLSYWLATWTALYWLCLKYFYKQTAEWSCRWVTLIHGTLVTALTAYGGFIAGPWPFTDPAGPNTPLQDFTIKVSLAYFLFDIGWCLYFKSEGIVMLLHHTTTIVFYTFSLLSGYYGCEVCAVAFGSEISNPFLQIRWFLREANRGQTKLALFVEASFVLLFSFVRVGVGLLLAKTYLSNPKPPVFTKIGGIVMYGIGLVFWLRILRMCYRKFYSKTRRDRSIVDGKLKSKSS